MRGEYSPAHFGALGKPGSSPRAWGIHLSICSSDNALRFIPTCVGNTLVSLSVFPVIPVHPHVRGEYLPCFLSKMEADGSSPRAWGILRFHPAPVLQGRFIPTCVGNTSFSMGSARLLSVHPHVRGEYLHSAMGKKRPRGSSPRAWGIPSKSAKKLTMCRFIPTCVGNTFCNICIALATSVHPHVRGEYPNKMA